MVNLIRTICATAAVFFIQVAVFAQEAGFFVHTIRQGETVYSIARTYQVSPDEILKLNPSAAAGIRTGATLQIPQKSGGTQSERFHTIAAGETLYRLTKTYQVSAEDICKANPGLTAENFKVGMVVRIPAASVQVPPVTPSVAPEPQGIAKSDCKEMHKVGRKETVYGIARQYGITEDELKAANPEMKAPDFKLKKGTFVCIPYPTVRKPQEIIPTNEELMPKKAIAAPQKHISMGVILPFKSHAAETAKMVEFYRGVLIAVDSIKRSGISVDVFAYDSGKVAGRHHGRHEEPSYQQARFHHRSALSRPDCSVEQILQGKPHQARRPVFIIRRGTLQQPGLLCRQSSQILSHLGSRAADHGGIRQG